MCTGRRLSAVDSLQVLDAWLLWNSVYCIGHLLCSIQPGIGPVSSIGRFRIAQRASFGEVLQGGLFGLILCTACAFWMCSVHGIASVASAFAVIGHCLWPFFLYHGNCPDLFWGVHFRTMSGHSHALRDFVCNERAHAWMSAAHHLSLVIITVCDYNSVDALSVSAFFYKHACSACCSDA
jgi:hypothetical protein